MKSLLTRLWKEEEGQDLTEYALLVVLISLAATASISNVSTKMTAVFSNVAANLST
jgi:pilus assembly protein Flp/PilA